MSKINDYVKPKAKRTLIQAWLKEDQVEKLNKFKKNISWSRLIEACFDQIIEKEKL